MVEWSIENSVCKSFRRFAVQRTEIGSLKIEIRFIHHHHIIILKKDKTLSRHKLGLPIKGELD
jgi:hypothetical protein